MTTVSKIEDSHESMRSSFVTMFVKIYTVAIIMEVRRRMTYYHVMAVDCIDNNLKFRCLYTADSQIKHNEWRYDK